MKDVKCICAIKDFRVNFQTQMAKWCVNSADILAGVQYVEKLCGSASDDSSSGSSSVGGNVNDVKGTPVVVAVTSTAGTGTLGVAKRTTLSTAASSTTVSGQGVQTVTLPPSVDGPGQEGLPATTKTAIEVAIPIVVVLLVVIGFLLYRWRGRRKVRESMQDDTKIIGELEGGKIVKRAELNGKSRVRAELEGKGNKRGELDGKSGFRGELDAKDREKVVARALTPVELE